MCTLLKGGPTLDTVHKGHFWSSAETKNPFRPHSVKCLFLEIRHKSMALNTEASHRRIEGWN
jgi:hypothetical protein